jgi:hypothetical protein
VIIAVDFDGTIAEHEFPHIGPAVPGAIEWLKRWQEAGAKLILWTMRSNDRQDEEHPHPLGEANDWCRTRGIFFWGVNANPDQWLWTTSPKAYAHLYVDDASFGCPLKDNPTPGGRPYVDWDLVGPIVLAMIEKENE